MEDPPPALRAQLLATEHWSLLATRSTAQAEVLTRIAILLTVISASVVSLALIGNATDFDDRFSVFAILLLTCVLLVGVQTLVRVHNASEEDLALVIGMNRLRAAYVELDPGIERYLVAGHHDDEPGARRTYNFWGVGMSQVIGSTGMLVMVVDAVIAGMLTGLVADALGATDALVGLLSAVVAGAFLAMVTALSVRRYRATQRDYVPINPTPSPGAAGDRATDRDDVDRAATGP